MKFRPVWISSLAHLRTFGQIMESAPLPRMLLGLYRIPASFPHLLSYWGLLPFPRVPIVYFAQGTLSIDAPTIRFVAEPPHLASVRYRGVDSQLEFQLSAANLSGVERYQSPQLPRRYMQARYYSINWVRLRTAEPILGGDFLLCVGGKGPFMGKIRAATDQLHAALQLAYTNSHDSRHE